MGIVLFFPGIFLTTMLDCAGMLAWLYVAVLPLLFGAAAAEYPDPEPCTGACNVRDPAVIRRESDGLYFWFSSHDKIKYAASRSLFGPWTALGSVVPNGSKIELDGRDDLWVSDRPLRMRRSAWC